MFQEARRLNQSDPLVLNEIGVVHYHKLKYSEARSFLTDAFKLCMSRSEEISN